MLPQDLRRVDLVMAAGQDQHGNADGADDAGEVLDQALARPGQSGALGRAQAVLDDLLPQLLGQSADGQHLVDALFHALSGVVGMRQDVLEVAGDAHRCGRRGCDEHDAAQAGGLTRGQDLGCLAAHGVAHHDVLAAAERVDDALRVVGELLDPVGAGDRGGPAPPPVVGRGERLPGM